jgi:hypothetical protein
MAAKYSEAVKALIDNFRETNDMEQVFDDDFARLVWGGKGCKASELSDSQILQFLLLDAHSAYAELARTVGQAAIEKHTMNREQRRKLERVRR